MFQHYQPPAQTSHCSSWSLLKQSKLRVFNEGTVHLLYHTLRLAGVFWIYWRFLKEVVVFNILTLFDFDKTLRMPCMLYTGFPCTASLEKIVSWLEGSSWVYGWKAWQMFLLFFPSCLKMGLVCPKQVLDLFSIFSTKTKDDISTRFT